MGYLTPDIEPDNATCRALFIPNSEQFLAIVKGAIQELTEPESWVKFGTLTPEQAAAACVDMFDRLSFNEGSCRVIGEIILYAGDTNPYPEKWVVCDGNERLIADYPDLFDVIGYLYGAHDETHFWLPNLSLHVAMGAAPEAEYPIGMYLGSDDIEVTESELEYHAHDIPLYSTALAVSGGDLVVVVPTEDITETGQWGTDDPQPITNYQPTVLMTYFIVAKG